jgi:catechol 2,3-dioxygenase-like lactoylglutathione lyase family enzyme
MTELITGIQQVGIGVQDADTAKLAYKMNFGMNVKVFDDVAEASLMTKYTGNEKHRRRAILSLNMAGGGGFEIWQFLSRKAIHPNSEITLGDTGIFAAKIKSQNIQKSYQHFQAAGNNSLTVISKTNDNRNQFWVKDDFGNWFNIIESKEWYRKNRTHCGGVCGAVIGVGNMKNALHFYADVLGISNEVFNVVDDAQNYPASVHKKFHRVLIRKETSKSGAFAKLLGDIEIELVQDLDKTRTPIYKNRFWGDCGFIHLCFDVTDMDLLKIKCEQAGYLFTVDSKNSFAMDAAAGRFCYVEDNDGTLIELVETHKVPVIKKIGLYLNLKKRKVSRPLPFWIIGCLALSKIK